MTDQQRMRVVRFRIAFMDELPDICERPAEDILKYLNTHKDLKKEINKIVIKRVKI